MSQLICTESAPQHQLPAGLIEDLTEKVEELIDLVDQENRFLAIGFPVGISENTDRKLRLSKQCVTLWSKMTHESGVLLAGDPELTRVLLGELTRLRESARENMVRLEAAMAASRRRVEAVLEVLRNDTAMAQPYSANGNVALPTRLPSFNTNFQA